MPREFFVTGTDTGVGKTLVTAALLRRLRESGVAVAGMKPVAAGSVAGPEGPANEDALLLQAESSVRHPYAVVNPWLFEPAIAPHLAAAEAGITIDTARIVAAHATAARRSRSRAGRRCGGIPRAARRRAQLRRPAGAARHGSAAGRRPAPRLPQSCAAHGRGDCGARPHARRLDRQRHRSRALRGARKTSRP